VGVSFFIARRYLVSRKSTNVINVISGISAFGILFCTAALIVLLSAFNGLESWVVRIYNSFDPDLKVIPVNERFFKADSVRLRQIRDMDGVKELVEVLEENGLVSFQEAQYICTIRGVSKGFLNTTGLDSQMTAGRFRLERGGQPAALLGAGIAYALSANLNSINHPLDLYVPRPNMVSSLNPAEAFHHAQIFPAGFFEIQPEYDSKYLIVPIDFARELFLRENVLSHLELVLHPDANKEKIRIELADILGTNFAIKDRFEQHEVLYKIINSEKWAVFLIGLFILLVAAFNITGTLTMLIVDKTRDIGTLRCLGLSWRKIRRIFFLEGVLVSLAGLFGGILLGTLLVWLQQETGFVMINQQDAYPVEFQWNDYLMIILTVAGIGALAAWFPSSGVYRRYSLRES